MSEQHGSEQPDLASGRIGSGESDEKRTAYTGVRPDICNFVPQTSLRILDVGCSNGALGRALLAMKPGRTVDGIEADASFCRQARDVLTNVINADLNAFSWRDLTGPYDCIVFADVLEHLIDPGTPLVRARNLLAPGGSIVVSFPNIRHFTALNSIYVRGTFPRRERGVFDRTHLRWFTLRDMKELLESSGFHIARVEASLRLRDRGGGLVNRVAQRALHPVRHWGPIREFLTYQYCLRAVTKA